MQESRNPFHAGCRGWVCFPGYAVYHWLILYHQLGRKPPPTTCRLSHTMTFCQLSPHDLIFHSFVVISDHAACPVEYLFHR